MCSSDLFVSSFAPKPKMFVFGAIDFASAVARVGKFLGYYVVVCDARAIFATPKRFPDADEVVVDWPHRWLSTQKVDSRTVICVLTHDPKLDDPALVAALRSKAFYIGALGSRKTHARRLERLAALGFGPADTARIHGPVGLDINAIMPSEIAEIGRAHV